jgi:hypothetical protein
MQATDDRELRAAVFYDPQNDTVIGGAELKGKSQAVELKLPVNANSPVGLNLATMLARALKTGAASGNGGRDGGIHLLTYLADAGGNIAVISTAVRAR